MSLMPAFEMGLWNAWILMLAVIFSTIPPLLIMSFSKGEIKVRLSGIPTNPPFNQTEERVKLLGNVLIIILIIYSVFLPLQLGTIWFYLGLAIFLLGFIARQADIVPWITTPLDKPVTTGLP